MQTSDTSKNGYQYRCVATNSEGTATSSWATLTVNVQTGGVFTVLSGFPQTMEAYSVGTGGNSVAGLSGASLSSVDDTHVYAGAKRLNALYLQGTTGNVAFGWNINFTAKGQIFREGDAVRQIAYFYFPSSYNFATDTSTGGLKFWCYSKRRISTGANNGRIYCNIRNQGTQLRFDSEAITGEETAFGFNIPRDSWWRATFEVGFGSVGQSNGGNGYYEFYYANAGTGWSDVLVKGVYAYPSINVGDEVWEQRLSQYWNGGAPVTQDFWADNISIEYKYG